MFLVNKKNKSSNCTCETKKNETIFRQGRGKEPQTEDGIPGWGSFFPWEGVEGGPHILGRSRPIRQAETNREWEGSLVEGTHCTFPNKGCVGSGTAWSRRSPP